MKTIQILGNEGKGKYNRLIVYDGNYHSKFMYQLADVCCWLLLVGNQNVQHQGNLMKEKGGFHFLNYLASISRIIALGK